VLTAALIGASTSSALIPPLYKNCTNRDKDGIACEKA
jgi:hypothetical protein